MNENFPNPNSGETHDTSSFEGWRSVPIAERDAAALQNWTGLVRTDVEQLGQQLQTAPEPQLVPPYRRRVEQLDSAQRFNTIQQFVDEVDESVYRGYIGTPGALPDTFRLPHDDDPTTDPGVAIGLLSRLPFVHGDSLPEDPEATNPKTRIVGPLEFPVERIIGADSLDSWAGRNDGMAGKDFYPQVVEDITQTSGGAIVNYAQLDPEGLKDLGDNAEVDIIQDASGEYWGFAHTDGSHRIAAAKLRGELTIPVNSVTIPAAPDMRRLPFSID